MNDPLIITFIGKGGTGKTILSAITGKVFSDMGKRVLLIDADPAMGLATALDIDGYKTIGKAREEIILHAKQKGSTDEKARLSDMIDYLLLETLYETNRFSMLVMGQTDTLGCYCPVNNILRDTIGEISQNFDIVIIDAEAGIEQINRQVVKSVQYPVIISDNSLRGVRTVALANQVIKRVPSMNPLKTGVLFNRVEEVDAEHIRKVEEEGIDYYGFIPADSIVEEMDRKGTSIMDMPDNSAALCRMKEFLKESISPD